MNALAKSPFWTPLFALDRLNSWLRSEEDRWNPIRSALKPVIYWTKTKAILEASKQYHIGLRRVMVKKPCRVCDATGRWANDFNWISTDLTFPQYRAKHGQPCRKCQATGTATLRFIESTIGPIVWHTPIEKWWSSSLEVYVPFKTGIDDPLYGYVTNGLDPFYNLTDWEPGQKGRPLSKADVERDLLILLEAFPQDVCFALDYHQGTEFAKIWQNANVPQARAWISSSFLNMAA